MSNRPIIKIKSPIVVCRTVVVASKWWAVTSMLPMLSEPCSCWPVAASVGSGH